MNRIKTIIVDDEPLAREGIRLLLDADPEISVDAELKSGYEAVDYLTENKADLMFLDIQMPGMTGFETLSRIPSECMPVIIFVTAYDQFALQAFKSHALDYVLKPISDEDFSRALKKAREIIQLKTYRKLTLRLSGLIEEMVRNPVNEETQEHEIKEHEKKVTAQYLERIPVTLSGRTFLVKTENIDWIEASDYYVKIHESGKSHLYRETMNNLEDKLDPSRFIRVHRSAIVNIDRIREIETYFNGEYMMVLSNGTKLKLSRGRKDQVKKLLNIK